MNVAKRRVVIQMVDELIKKTSEIYMEEHLKNLKKIFEDVNKIKQRLEKEYEKTNSSDVYNCLHYRVGEILNYKLTMYLNDSVYFKELKEEVNTLQEFTMQSGEYYTSLHTGTRFDMFLFKMIYKDYKGILEEFKMFNSMLIDIRKSMKTKLKQEEFIF